MPTCADCAYQCDYFDAGKCLCDLEYHDPNDTCPFWLGKNERINGMTGEKLGPLEGPK